jgi:essential protein Yae1
MDDGNNDTVFEIPSLPTIITENTWSHAPEHNDPWADVFESDYSSPSQLPSIPPPTSRDTTHNTTLASTSLLSPPSRTSMPSDSPQEPQQTRAHEPGPATISPLHGIISDVPRLRAAHEAAGYREGISASKARYVQAGFDEGWVLGAEVGYAVGFVLAALEGVVAAVEKNGTQDGDGCEGKGAGDEGGEEGGKELAGLAAQARRELEGGGVFTGEWFDEEGVWRWEMDRVGEGRGAEEHFSLQDIAMAHPLVKKWMGEVDRISLSLTEGKGQVVLRPSRR